LGNGDGTFQTQQTHSIGYCPWAVALSDVNGDRNADVVTVHIGTFDNVGVLLGNGDGTFQTLQTWTAGVLPRSVALSDVNGDSKVDVVTGNDELTVNVLVGNGDGTFQMPQTYSIGGQPSSVAVSDVNGDSNPDVVTANGAWGTLSVLLGNGDGTFQAHQTFSGGDLPASVAILDVNGDNAPDIVTADPSPSSHSNVNVLLGSGDGTFQTRQIFGVGDGAVCVAIADLNADDKPDIVTANSTSDNVSVLLNLGGSDTTPPTVTSAQQQLSAPNQLSFTFSENIAGSVSIDDLIVTAVPSGAGVAVSSFSYDPGTNITTFNLPTSLGNGNYRATLPAGCVCDGAGNPIASDCTLDFFMLAGDANHDRKVDVVDLEMLVTNWQQSPRDFSEGDFDYSGTVDVNDLGIFASNWQQTLAPPLVLQQFGMFAIAEIKGVGVARVGSLASELLLASGQSKVRHPK
jgi:hypothetical protein